MNNIQDKLLIVAQSAVSNFNAYALLIGLVIGFIVYLFWIAHKLGAVDWTDMITSKGSNRVSLTKFLQLMGGITATWIMIYMTLHALLTVEFLFTYLTYVGAIEGWSKFVSMKYNAGSSASQESTAYVNPTQDSSK